MIDIIDKANKMGNQAPSFQSRLWKFQERHENYDLYSDGDGLYAEKHYVPNNIKITPEEEMEVYYYRSKVNKPIVRVYDAEYANANSLCTNDKNITVYSEYIPYRLSETRNLNHGQGLYVLNESLIGFHELYHRFGPFPVTEDHIGFNQDGETKVWLNQNFATNHLERDSILLMATTNPKNFDERMNKRQEEEMVEDIWMAVDDHANFDFDFKAKVNEFREMNFVEARNILKEEI